MMALKFDTQGIHIICDMWGIEPHIIDNMEGLEFHITQAVKKCKSNLVKMASEQFFPSGVTIVGLLEESHISIHTYPEEGYAAIDCFTCGSDAIPQNAIDYFVEVLQPKKVNKETIVRGQKTLKI